LRISPARAGPSSPFAAGNVTYGRVDVGYWRDDGTHAVTRPTVVGQYSLLAVSQNTAGCAFVSLLFGSLMWERERWRLLAEQQAQPRPAQSRDFY
jgi:hypothetical protein